MRSSADPRSPASWSARALLLAVLLSSGASCRSGFPSEEPAPGRAPAASARAATVARPLAAALSPDGEVMYLARLDAAGAALVMMGPTGGALQSFSMPLAMPLALSVLPDSSGVLVVDAGGPEGPDSAGAVYLIDPAGSFRTLSGAGIRLPVAVAAAPDGSAAYVCAQDAADDQPGVFRIPLDGSPPQLLYKGAPLARPVALSFAENGYLYVADADALGPRSGGLIRIEEGRALLLSRGALPIGPGAGLAPSAQGSGSLLALSAAGASAWLLELRADGSWSELAPVGDRPHDPLTLARAARADLWIAVDGVSETQPDPNDPVQGQLLRLQP
jgi:hypothetical protein